MKTIRIDDRTEEQKKTHTVLITATDKFMSGWGLAKNGLSKCAWACRPEDRHKVYNWVKSRSDMKFVNMHHSGWKPKAAHVHIYVVKETHPALGKLMMDLISETGIFFMPVLTKNYY